MNENITVAIRVKPILKGDNPAQDYVIAPNSESNEIYYMNKESRTQKLFSYDYVADSDLGQSEFFDKIQMKQKVSQLMDGYNATVFAYGPTGSGKTYTIQGKPLDTRQTQNTSSDLENDENLGLIPRALAYLFSHIRK
jgi:kinesin family protein 11